MAESRGGVVQIPFYATLFRGDRLEAALAEIATIALRYGARRYEVLRARDDRYRMSLFAEFDDPLDFDRYWQGEEFIDWRAAHSSWYQVPVVYVWNDSSAAGALVAEEEVL